MFSCFLIVILYTLTVMCVATNTEDRSAKSSADVGEENVCYLKDMVAKLKEKKKHDPELKLIFQNEELLFTPRSILEGLKECTTFHGDIIIDKAGYVSPDSKSEGSENVRTKDLYNLVNLRRLYGRKLALELSKYPSIKSLNFLKNLHEVHVDDFFLHNSNVEAMNFTGMIMNVTWASIQNNRRLCFLDNFEENLARKIRPYIKHNRPYSDCLAAGQVCHASCADASGCWGPGPLRCGTCGAFRADLRCVDSCPPGFFPGENAVCGRCHSECQWCSGPMASDCNPCKRARDGASCVDRCPVDKFMDRRNACQPCSSRCVHGSEKVTDLCSGPSMGDCLHTCTGNKFVATLSGRRVCRACHPSCSAGCVGPGERQCLRCDHVKADLLGVWQCLDVCPRGYSDSCFCLFKTRGRICYEKKLERETCRTAIILSTVLIGLTFSFVCVFVHYGRKIIRFSTGRLGMETVPSRQMFDDVIFRFNTPQTHSRGSQTNTATHSAIDLAEIVDETAYGNASGLQNAEALASLVLLLPNDNDNKNSECSHSADDAVAETTFSMDQPDCGSPSGFQSLERLRQESLDQPTSLRSESAQSDGRGKQFRFTSNNIPQLNNKKLKLSLNDEPTLKDLKSEIKKVYKVRDFAVFVFVGKRENSTVYYLDNKWIDVDGKFFKETDRKIENMDKLSDNNNPMEEPLTDKILQLLLKNTDSDDVIPLEVKPALARHHSR